MGPGVYEDHEKFRSLTKQPCAALYKQSHYMKDGGGKDGYMFINGNMIQYEPCFDKSKQKDVVDKLNAHGVEVRVPMRPMFNERNLEVLQSNY